MSLASGTQVFFILPAAADGFHDVQPVESFELVCMADEAFSPCSLFGGVIYKGNPALSGSPYDEAQGAYSYLPMNFNDIPSGLITLFALVVVNNWMVLQVNPRA